MTAIHRFVEACQNGTLPRCLGRMSSGWAVLGDPQVRPGYCLLYPDPVVATLNDLTSSDRAAFLQDMCKLGDAVLAVTGATRINYEILGNLEPALHAHLIPRSITEPEEVRTKPIWLEDWSVVPPFDPEFHGELKAKLQKELGL